MDNNITPDSAEVTKRTSRPIPDSPGALTPFSTTEVLRRPSEAPPAGGVTLAGGVVTKGPFKMPILPPPVIIPMGSARYPAARESQSISGDENPHKDPLREQSTCLRCTEYGIDCHGPEIELDGHCSKCHEDGKRCEFESRASDQNFNAPSSSQDPQSSAINDEMLRPTIVTSNDNRTNIDIRNPQPNPSSSGRQDYHKTPIKDGPRDRETPNTIGISTDDHFISGEPQIKPWWKRLFSCENRRAKRKRRS